MSWQTLLRENVTTAEELTKCFQFSEEEYRNIRDEVAQFPMSVTKYYLSLIDPEDPDDPIRKMAVPSGQPVVFDGSLDTSGEAGNTVIRGTQHKYAQTVLVLTTTACAMYCRHCFRRRLVGMDREEAFADCNEVAAYIRKHPEVNNVLLSGGDAFLMPTEKITEWLQAMTELDQLDFIRFGTRTPVTFPQRILMDPELVEQLSTFGKKKQIYVVTHFNHPREFTEESKAAVKALQRAGVVLKNQTVLMRGINDDPAVLADVLRGASAQGIVQHYIFQCRPVTGVKSRFQVPLREGLRIVSEANKRQNGLGKVADYTMSHVTGKIRILGEAEDGKLMFQYKQAKDPARIGKIFSHDVGEETWLPEDLTV